jgi:hypothetical protein
MVISNSDNNKSTRRFSTSSSNGALYPLCNGDTNMKDHSAQPMTLRLARTLACVEQARQRKDYAIESVTAFEKGELPTTQPLAPRARRAPTRPVRFGVVRIREYGVTVGAYAAANDSCPLQLTWEYSPHETCLDVDEHQIRAREGGSGSPQPLSPNARRSRIARVQGTTNLMIARLERDLALELIQETIESLNVLRRRGQTNSALHSKPPKMTATPRTRRNRLAQCADLLDEAGRLQLE